MNRRNGKKNTRVLAKPSSRFPSRRNKAENNIMHAARKMSHTEIACISTQSISRWRDELRSEERDDLVVEIPVALEFNGISHAVMLTTPCDLESFALGFSLSEGIIKNRGEFFGAEVEGSDLGITVHCDIS